MADKTISEIFNDSPAATLTGQEIIPGVQSGGTVGMTTRAIAGIPGPAIIIQKTYTEAQALIGSFVVGAYYLITDGGVSDLGVLVHAISSTTLSPTGIGGWYLPDFQAIGNYSDVSGFGQNRGLWVGADESDYSVGDVVIWNGFHWRYSGGGDGVTVPSSGNYTLLQKSESVGYIIEWDAIKYDFSHDWIFQRTCKRGNLWEQSDEGYPTVGFLPSLFQWGNDSVYDNQMRNGQIECVNQAGTIYQNIAISGGSIVSIGNRGQISRNLVLNDSLFDCSNNSGEISGNNIQGGSGLSATNNGGLIKYNLVHRGLVSFDSNTGEIAKNSYINCDESASTGNDGQYNGNAITSNAFTSLSGNLSIITNNTITGGASLIGSGNNAEYSNNTVTSGISIDLTDNAETITGLTVNLTKLKKATEGFTLNSEGEVLVTSQGASGTVQVELGSIREATKYSFYVHTESIWVKTRPGDTIVFWDGSTTQTVDTDTNGSYFDLSQIGMSAQLQKIDNAQWAVMANNGGIWNI